MCLYALLFTPQNVENEAEMAEMNKMASDFLETYKGNDYGSYTVALYDIATKLPTGVLAMSFSWAITLLLEGMSRHLGNNIAAGFAFDVLYRDFDLSFRFNYAATKTKREITHHDIPWPAGIRGYLAGADLALHYPIYQSSDCKLLHSLALEEWE